MNREELHLIQLDWDGPYRLEDLQTLKNEETDYGVYQIYGNHPVYGSDVLLYIGKADAQTLGKRILQEDWIYTNDSRNIKIYIGRLYGQEMPSEEIWSKEIDLAERLLIYVHKPAYNAKSISSLPDKEFQDIHIINWGHYRSLLPELSGLRWTKSLYDRNYELYKYSFKV